jgi:hypothetical protein
MFRAMFTSGWKVRASCGLPLGLDKCCVICMIRFVMAGLQEKQVRVVDSRSQQGGSAAPLAVCGRRGSAAVHAHALWVP